MNDPLVEAANFSSSDMDFKTGANSCIGKLTTTLSDRPDLGDRTYVYKFNKYHDNSILHEFSVAKDLQLCAMRDSFCKPISCEKRYVIDRYRVNDPDMGNIGVDNPFIIPKGSKRILKDILFYELIDGTSFYSFIKCAEDRMIYSIILQTMVALLSAQSAVQFTHNDLHPGNIMVVKCDHNLVKEYTINGKELVIPTYGYRPVIIDFGFSTSQSVLTSGNFNTHLGYTKYGFIPLFFDRNQDFMKLILTCVEKTEGNANFDDLYDLSRKNYTDHRIELDSGWDELDSESINQKLMYKYEDLFEAQTEDFFIDNISEITEIFMNLIQMPIKRGKLGSYKEITIILNELNFLNDLTKHDFYKLYILHRLINSVCKYRDEYLENLKDKKKRDDIMAKFKADIMSAIDDTVKYVSKISVNYEKLFSNLLVLGNNIATYVSYKLELLEETRRKIAPKTKPFDLLLAIDSFAGLDYYQSEATKLQRQKIEPVN
jgi:hypothetical protein